MKKLLCLVLIFLWSSFAQADPWITLKWTNPQFNAALDDSGRSYCASGADTLRDLARIYIWGQPSYGGPPKIVKEVSAFGREGMIDSASVDREANWIHWHYWAYAADMSGNLSPCPSNNLYVAGSAV